MLILLLGVPTIFALITWSIVGIATFSLKKTAIATTAVFLVTLLLMSWLFGIPILSWGGRGG